MLKWRLLLTTLPIVAGVLIAKLLVGSVFGFTGLIEFTDIALVLTGGVFLIGFMLAGTMADYKESEKIPAELAGQFETLEDSLEHAVAVNKTPIDRTAVMGDHAHMVHTVHEWLLRKKTDSEVYAAIHDVTLRLHDLERQGVHGGACGKMTGDLDKIRRAVGRIGVISRTGFLASGYALLEILIGLIIVLLVISSYKNMVAEFVVITFITLIYVYMYRLIKDVDDPFEYGEGRAGCAEVPLFPLTDYIDRFHARHAALPQRQARVP